MPIEITVPRLGWSMEEGAFVAWLKKDGELVRAGDPLFSIEGDKAVQDIESIDSGILRIAPGSPQPGGAVRVGDLLGYLLSAEEASAGAGTPQPAPGVSTDARANSSGQREPDSAPPKAPAKSKNPAGTVPIGISEGSPGRAISPRAVRVAAELGVDWTRVAGTGRTGRIRERDVRAAAGDGAGGSGSASASAIRAAGAPPSTGGSRPRAVFFGELLMRLATRQHERFVQAREFEVRYTGAEANAAVSVVNFGLEAFAVSAVPDTELGQACVNYLRQHGVNADHVARRGSRLGTFYLETGAPPRPSKVIYDRAGSAFAELKPGDLDWDTILAGKQWLHWSGTAPALSPSMPAVVAEACTAARRHGLKISCDLNYREKLWTPDLARKAMTPLLRHVDVLIASEEHIRLVLGAEAGGAAGAKEPGRTAIERCAQIAGSLRAQLGLCDVAITRRGGDPVPSRWQCLLENQAGAFASREYSVASVDRIGAGDAFAGALIHAMLSGLAGPDAIEFAAAAGCLKHSIAGDFNLVSCDEVLALVRGDAGHRVQR